MKALIDGDILVYSCGFASDANAKEQGIEAEPVEFCLNGVKETIRSLCDATEADDYIIFLTGKDNFRYKVSPDYKANRKDAAKPVHYDSIRRYLQDHHPCSVSVGEEADDELGRYQVCAEQTTTVIISKDKDLDMIRGWHYNWSPKNKEKGMYFTSEIDGLRIFYKQLITGDATDNISGVYRLFGRKATKGLLEPLDIMRNERDMFQYVLDEAYRGDIDLMDKQAKLLWIRTNETWEEHFSRL
jgi:DNA polymerase-1